MKRQELIEKYVHGTLTEEERLTFNELISTDAEFAEEVRFQEDVKVVARHEDSDQFKQQLRSYENQRPSSSKRRRWVAAAILVALLATAYFTVFQNTNSKLFAEYFEPYRNVVAPVVRGDQSEALSSKAFLAYENKAYKEAASYFSQLIDTENESYYTFYLANCELALGQGTEAIVLLENYIATSGEFTDRAQWYLALAYVTTNENTKAKSHLERIVATNSYNHQEALQLLNHLK